MSRVARQAGRIEGANGALPLDTPAHAGTRGERNLGRLTSSALEAVQCPGIQANGDGIVNASDNKRIMQEVFEQLAQGNGKPFGELMAEDFCWTITGTTPWSGTYRGRQEVRSRLLGPLFAQFAERYTNTAQRILADGDWVVVECRGRVTLKSGKPYHNCYCYVIRMEQGRMKELTEYLDTQLVATALEAPA